MKINIQNFDTLKSGQEPVPEGKYNVVIKACQEGDNKDKTGKIVNIRTQILDKEHNGRGLFIICSLKPDALWNIKALCVAAKVPLDSSGFKSEDAIGRKMRVIVYNEEYQGIVRNKVKSNYAPCTLE